MTSPASEVVERYAQEFETARLRGPVSFEAYLPPKGDAMRTRVLRELVRIDLEMSWDRGERRTVDDYVRSLPELATDAESIKEIAQEEYRVRLGAGDWPDPDEYQRRFDMPVDRLPSTDEVGTPDFVLRSGSTAFLKSPNVAPGSTRRIQRSHLPESEGVRGLLQVRLRYISLAASLYFAYHAWLTILNPHARVGLFLEGGLVALNWIAFTINAALTTLLWKRKRVSLSTLRLVELGIFGLAAADLSAGLYDDLFVGRELLEPLAKGGHALFHFSSSWCLPFFALIVAYGILVPSGWKRCLSVVGVIAAAPLLLSLAAGFREAAMSSTFVESFLVQMFIWMAIAVAIALFGAARLEALRQEAAESRRLGPYRLVQRIASGGMGEVHIAEHALLRRPCAVKLIRSEHAEDARMISRFEREVQATAALTHPNTVQVFDFGRAEDGTFYFAMEYLPGPNLEQLLRREGPLQPRRAVHILRQLCGALQEAHARGLVHRDVKPTNVILCNLGGIPDFAKLLDFGLVHEPAGAKSQSLSLIGTPDFMSPEQASGKENVDARSDLYSLAATGFYLLTGRPLFRCDTLAAKLAAHRLESPPSIRALRPEVPPALESAILHCLAKNPEERCPSAKAFAEALDAAVA